MITKQIILDMVCQHFGISADEVLSKSRFRSTSQVRWIAIHLIREHCKSSYPEIGRFMKQADHTSAMFAVKEIAGRLLLDEHLAGEVAQIEARIHGVLRTGLEYGELPGSSDIESVGTLEIAEPGGPFMQAAAS